MPSTKNMMNLTRCRDPRVPAESASTMAATMTVMMKTVIQNLHDQVITNFIVVINYYKN